MKITLPIDCPHCGFEYDLFVPAEDLIQFSDGTFNIATACGDCEKDIHLNGSITIQAEIKECESELTES